MYKRQFQHYDDEMPADAARGFHFAERPASAVIDRALRWLETRTPGTPVFLWVHLFDPHDPYAPAAEYLHRAGGDAYRGEIAYVDAQVSRLFDRLRARGGWDATLVIVTSDHGESLGSPCSPRLSPWSEVTMTSVASQPPRARSRSKSLETCAST